jgi:peptide/nickel transport system ATP-binding protein
VQDLKTYFEVRRGQVKAVDGVRFDVKKGEAVGLAGESGCGKTTLAYSVMKLIPKPGRIVSGNIYFEGRDLVPLSESEIRKIRWKRMAIVFQGAMSALNPVLKVGEQITEPILLHSQQTTEEEAIRKAKTLFELVGLDPARTDDYPHQFSGGMRQRAMIAMSLACDPDLLIADEPITALDVTIQAQIMELLKTLQKKLSLSMILITHDLSVIAETCDRVVVMYAGKVAEFGDVVSIFKQPLHPYTKGLIDSVPTMEKAAKKKLTSVPGQPPDLIDPPTGCRFNPRCPFADEICRREEPPLIEEEPHHWVACHHVDLVRVAS